MTLVEGRAHIRQPYKKLRHFDLTLTECCCVYAICQCHSFVCRTALPTLVHGAPRQASGARTSYAAHCPSRLWWALRGISRRCACQAQFFAYSALRNGFEAPDRRGVGDLSDY